MAYDGTLKFDTRIITDGFQAGVNGIIDIAQKGIKATTAILSGAAAAVGAIGTAAIRVGSSFEAGMSKVQAIAGTVADEDLPGIIRKAKEMENEYIRRAESCTTVTELMTLDRKMLEDFIIQVRRTNENPLISPAIREGCDFIRANIMKSFTLADVAKHVGYTEYYFTRKFNKEMGIRVNDFVKEAKVEYAKIQLLTTSQGIQEISDTLNFGNRTYFSKVFREITGMTPAAFRSQLGKEKEDETAERT